MTDIFTKINNNTQLNHDDVVAMLSIKPGSKDYYSLLYHADSYSRGCFDNTGIIFAQIGIDSAACSVNCRFCQLAADNFLARQSTEISCDELVERVANLVNSGANEVFLMSTVEYDKDRFLQLGSAVRKVMPAKMRLVANVGDFTADYAQKLKNAGFTGVYHICRLGEGEDTAATPQERIATLNAIKSSGLEMYYCVEPIGPEHTNAQIADEILRGVEYSIDVMAVMRRVNFSDSPMSHHGEITAQRLAQICAVTTLCVRPKRAMGVHEPEIISLVGGANQIYAEIGSNPRDTSLNTEKSRGFSVADAKKMLCDAGWQHR